MRRWTAAGGAGLGACNCAIEMAIPAGTTVNELIDRLKQAYPVLRAYTRFLSVAVNRAYVGMSTELHDGDEVACLPPVGGG